MKTEGYSVRAWVLALAALAVLGLSSPGWAAVYYVATTGSDSNAGTSTSAPWRTIAKANSTLRAGDTVYIRNGTYTDQIRPAYSGTAGNYITYARYQTETPTVDRNAAGSGIYLQGRSYIKIDGLHVTDVTSFVQSGSNGYDYCVIQNCTFDGTVTSYAAFEIEDGCYYNKILNNTIDVRAGPGGNDGVNIGSNNVPEAYGGARHNLFQGNTIIGGSHSSMNVGGDQTRYNIIKDNRMYQGAKVFAFGAYNSWTLVEGNLIGNPSDGVVFQWRADDCIARFNRFYLNASQIAESGSVIMMQATTARPYVRRNHVFHNTAYIQMGTREIRAIRMQLYDAAAYLDDNIFKNNIFYTNATSSSPIQLVNYSRAKATEPTDRFINNIMGRQTANLTAWSNNCATGDECDAYRSLSQSRTKYPNVFSASNYEADPKLSNPAGNDFSLLAGSPAIDAGAALTTVTSAPGSGTTFTVADARYFTNGWGIIAGDTIRVGDDTVTITNINYGTNQITVGTSFAWANGDPVNLPFNGARPDIGAVESGQAVAGPAPSPEPAPSPDPEPPSTPASPSNFQMKRLN